MTCQAKVRGDTCGDDRLDWKHDPDEHKKCADAVEYCLLHEYIPDAKTVPEFSDLTPSDEGYAAIAETFIDSILRDVPVGRKQAVREQLGQVLTIVGYFAQHSQPERAVALVQYTVGE